MGTTPIGEPPATLVLTKNCPLELTGTFFAPGKPPKRMVTGGHSGVGQNPVPVMVTSPPGTVSCSLIAIRGSSLGISTTRKAAAATSPVGTVQNSLPSSNPAARMSCGPGGVSIGITTFAVKNPVESTSAKPRNAPSVASSVKRAEQVSGPNPRPTRATGVPAGPALGVASSSGPTGWAHTLAGISTTASAIANSPIGLR
jgi:hypothetical protein